MSSVDPLQPAILFLQVAAAEVGTEDGLDALQQPAAQQQHVQHGPGGQPVQRVPGQHHGPSSTALAGGSLCQCSHHTRLFALLHLRAFLGAPHAWELHTDPADVLWSTLCVGTFVEAEQQRVD